MKLKKIQERGKRKISFVIIFTLCFYVLISADYRSVMMEANSVYRIGDYTAALELYREAYSIKPDPKVAAFIKKLEKKVEATTYEVVDPKADWAKQQNVLTIECLSMLLSQVTVSYQRALGTNLGFGASFFYSWNAGSLIFSQDLYGASGVSAYGGGLNFDFYADNKAPNGLYGGLDVNAGYSDYVGLFGVSVTGMANLHVGYRWIFSWGGVMEVQLAYTVAYLTMSYMPYLMGNHLSFGWAF